MKECFFTNTVLYLYCFKIACCFCCKYMGFCLNVPVMINLTCFYYVHEFMKCGVQSALLIVIGNSIQASSNAFVSTESTRRHLFVTANDDA